VEAARFAVIGDPVEHSLSPLIQKAAFEACNMAACYEAIRVTPGELGNTLANLRRSGYRGVNVTTPLKETAARICDELTPEAAGPAAVNVLRLSAERTTGHNTDGSGFIRALHDAWQWQPAGRSVLMLGSGPAARAVSGALTAGGAAPVYCWSRNGRTAALVGPAPETSVDLVVCALPPDARVPPAVLSFIASTTFVFDLNYGAARSPVPPYFGARRSDGLPLLLHQGALSFEWWTGKAAPLEAMRAALKR
jgi:shikimate dehydrogenase